MAEFVEKQEVQISLRDFLMVIFRRKWLILAMVGVTSTVVASALLLQPIVYTSDAKVMLVGVQRGSAVDRVIVPLNADELSSAECELIKSRPVLERAQAILDANAVKGEPKYKIQPGSIKPAPIPKSRMLAISYVAPEPDEAQKINQALTSSYLDYHKDVFTVPDLADFFDSELEKTGTEVTDLLNKKLEIYEANDITSIPGEMGVQYAVLSGLRNDLIGYETQIVALRSEIIAEEKLEKSDDASRYMSWGRVDTGILGATLKDLAQKLQERERLLTIYTERHPLVEQIDGEIEELRAFATAEKGRVLSLKRDELGRLEVQRDVVQHRISEAEERLRGIPAMDRDLTDLDKNLEAGKRHYSDLVYMKGQALASSRSMADYHITLLSEPTYGRPSNPRDLVRLSLGPILSLLVGIGLAFFFENLDHSLKNPEEVERYLELPVLTSVKRRRPKEIIAPS
jgi:polysaccharide biosynthesis transport protein